ncbi:MAG: hypothetical protein GPJ54_13675 [Candidatus Heimdallarchaeota archaeon]|nr:hypothetical protein [Candidatus Heimdallarchaeota archaeon]
MSSEEISETKLTSKPDDDLAFSRIKEEIETKAKATAEAVIKKANEEASDILKTSKDEATKGKNEILAKSEREAHNIKVQDISRKKLALKMDYLETREQVFEEIFVEARSKIQSFTSTEDYKKYLINLLKISGNSIGGGKLDLFLRKEDKAVFSKTVLSELESNITKFTGESTEISIAKDELKSLGGLKLVRIDSKLFIDNSFEKRLERANDDIRIELSELISE